MKNEKGQGLVEYVFMVALAVVIVVLVLAIFGNRLVEMFQDIVNVF